MADKDTDATDEKQGDEETIEAEEVSQDPALTRAILSSPDSQLGAALKKLFDGCYGAAIDRKLYSLMREIQPLHEEYAALRGKLVTKHGKPSDRPGQVTLDGVGIQAMIDFNVLGLGSEEVELANGGIAMTFADTSKAGLSTSDKMILETFNIITMETK